MPTSPTRAPCGSYRQPGALKPHRAGSAAPPLLWHRRLSAGTTGDPGGLQHPPLPISCLYLWMPQSPHHLEGDGHGVERVSAARTRGSCAGLAPPALPRVPNRQGHHSEVPALPFWKPFTKKMLLHLMWHENA